MHNNSLRSFLNGLPRGGVGALAQQLGVHSVYLSQLASGLNGRVPSPELCVRIEQLTEKAVARKDLRPRDWHLIWPELIGADGAPELPAVQAQQAA